MRFGEASVESALVWLGAIGERKACVCKCGMLLVSDRIGSDSSGRVHKTQKALIPNSPMRAYFSGRNKGSKVLSK